MTPRDMIILFVMTAAWLFLVLNSASAFSATIPIIDQVEIQWSICESSVKAVQKKLGLEFDLDEKPVLSYYDDLHLSLFGKNVVIRTRQSNKTKSTVKIRNLDLANIDWKWLENKEYKCEWDRFGSVRSLACSLSQKNEGVISAVQVEFLRRMGFIDISLYSLNPNGPYKYEKWVSHHDGQDGYGWVLEFAQLPKRSIIEISLRASLYEEEDVYQDMTRYLHQKGIRLCEVQRSFTERVLKPDQEYSQQP